MKFSPSPARGGDWGAGFRGPEVGRHLGRTSCPLFLYWSVPPAQLEGGAAGPVLAL
eukprot:CAMPEP_0119395736 /NCGR_PEP_ID=MMETSP1334-20130426/134401_1 /TAXON_ID=127549 /ORGANISM="Calcidiscus leptoporus, Strain RCC1130" /LENGTH=55 /DNA_ID=CAMNT_0007419263 /DNA_START=32 /DNA_END=200 /DNA_ORIENTATION=-